MRNDTGLPFARSHDSVSAFITAIEGIEQIALTERFDDAPLRLRLLTQSGTVNSTQDFTITPIDAFRGSEAYAAVSYVWAHDQSTQNLEIPEYRIWDSARPQSRPRGLRCPPIIFHRAVQYAKAKRLDYIWIDQECIDQDDDADRERHLQLMHRIYRASAVTIAILSTQVPNMAVFNDFADWALVDEGTHNQPRVLPHGVLADWLMTMTSDRWFTRTWTAPKLISMQEKLCSTHLEYLIPIAPCHEFEIDPRYQHLVIADDLAVDLQNSVANFDMMTSPEPGLLTAYQQLGRWLRSSTTRDELVRNIELTLYEMGPRSNLVLSDRLAILANVCGLRYTLRTTILNGLDVSYRTCLLVLTFANVWPDAPERLSKYRRFAAHNLGPGNSEISGSPDEILDEFLLRPRIGADMHWIHYDLTRKET